MNTLISSMNRLFHPPPRQEAVLARQQADRIIRAAKELEHPDVLAGFVRNVKGTRARSSRPTKGKTTS